MACTKTMKMKINGRWQEIPCGWCMACRIDRRNMWQDRIIFESQRTKKRCFATFTYSDENLPKNESLCKNDLKLFFRRLRIYNQRHGGEKMSYYAVGEYGGQTNRPHYHALIIGLDFHDDADMIEKEWGLGMVKLLPMNNGSIGYVLKYIEKEVKGQKAEEIYSKNGLEKPFAVMSKGIGKQYLIDHWEEIQELNGYLYKGKIRPIPKYYADLMKLGKNDDRMNQRIKRWKNSGYANFEDYENTINRLKELHMVKAARNGMTPIDDSYLQFYEKPLQYLKSLQETLQNETENIRNKRQSRNDVQGRADIAKRGHTGQNDKTDAGAET